MLHQLKHERAPTRLGQTLYHRGGPLLWRSFDLPALAGSSGVQPRSRSQVVKGFQEHAAMSLGPQLTPSNDHTCTQERERYIRNTKYTVTEPWDKMSTHLTGALLLWNLWSIAGEPFHKQGCTPPTHLPPLSPPTITIPLLSREFTCAVTPRVTAAADRHSVAFSVWSKYSATSRQCSSYCVCVCVYVCACACV